MLLQFSVENFCSIHKQQEFSMVSSSIKGCEVSLLHDDGLPNVSILPVAILYGANASGKSNFIESISWLSKVVRLSHSMGNPDGGVPLTPFALSSGAKDKPTEVDVDFILNGVRYNYGLSATDKAFQEEWLYQFPKGTRQLLFERTAPQEIKFGRALTGKNKIIADLMRDNSLFLSVAYQNGHQILSKIAKYITQLGGVGTPSASPTPFDDPDEENFDDRIIDVLRELGTGVVGYKERKEDIPEKIIKLNKSFNESLRSVFGDDDIPEFIEQDTQRTVLKMTHPDEDGEEIEFDISDESDGTRRLIKILGPIFTALDNGGVVVIDELDANLHTKASEAVIKLFSDPMINKKNAQLIATTHDTNLMMVDCLRRDQIWFVEKDKFGASHIYPLSDIDVRETDNFEKGYLQGRFGAIPFANSLDRLIEKLRTSNV